MTNDGRAPGATISAWSSDELARQILDRPPVHVRIGPQLAAAARALHLALDCSNSHTEPLLARLADRNTIVVRLAHQPNLFPYEQLVAQTLYLVDLAKRLNEAGQRVVPMLFAVDYDVCGDKRFKNARAYDPGLGREIRNFSLGIDKAHSDVPACLCAAPQLTTRKMLAAGLEEFARAHLAAPGYLLDHSGVMRPAATLPDFTLYAWANLSIRLWDLPMLFVRLSAVAPMVAAEQQVFARKLADHLSAEPGNFMWRICAVCNQRVDPTSRCCEGRFHNLELPRVILDDLGDHAIYGIAGGTAYRGGHGHLELAHETGAEIGIVMAPESSWQLTRESLAGHPFLMRVVKSETHAFILRGHNSLVAHLVDKERVFALHALARAWTRASFA